MSAAATEVRSIPLAAVTFSRTRSQAERRAHLDKGRLAELAESIKTVGLVQPILVRPAQRSQVLNYLPGDPEWEVVAGERRVLAARQAGLEEIPATIRELTDEQVLELQLIENLQRQDLHELAEAEGYEALQKLGHSIEDMAAKVGKSKGTIYARMKLLALCAQARKAFYAGEISASVALLLARIPVEAIQQKALKDLIGADSPSYREALDHIQRDYMLRLSEAPFPTGEEQLVRGAVACGRCPKNTLAQPELFGDVKGGSAGVCTDPGCFTAKRKAWGERLLEKARAAGREIITGEAAKKVAPYSLSNLHGYQRLDEKCHQDPKYRTVRQIIGKDAETALLQDSETGDVVEVVKESVVRSKLGLNRSSPSNPVQSDREKKAKAERAYRRTLFERLAAKLDLALPDPGELAFLRRIARELTCQMQQENHKQLCSIYGWEPEKGKYSQSYDAPIEKALERMDRSDQFIKFLEVCCLVPDLQVFTWQNEPPTRLLLAAKRLKIDPTKVRAELAAQQKAKVGAPAKAAKKKSSRKAT